MDSSIELEDHQISLVYTLGEADERGRLDRRVGDLEGAGGTFLKDFQSLNHYIGEEKIWTEKKTFEDRGDINLVYPHSIDLTKPVREVISGVRPGLLKRHVLNPNLQHMLRFGDLPSKCNADLSKAMICLEFGKRAKERLSANGIVPVPLWIDLIDVEHLLFGTGAVVVLVNVELRRVVVRGGAGQSEACDLSLVELQEAVHAFSRFNECTWYDRSTGRMTAAESFSFGTLVQRLVRESEKLATNFTRVPTYSYARTKQQVEPEVLEREAAYLARRYTSDYMFSYNEGGVEFLKDFDDMRHAITAESIATLQCGRALGEQTEFSRNWKTSALKAAYLPIYILLLHENWFLSDRRTAAVGNTQENALLDELEQILDETVLFGLYFRFPSFSQISIHQRMADAIRNAMQLDRKFAALQATAQQVSERLGSAYAEREAEASARREQTFTAVASFGTAALSGLTAYTILKDVLLLFANSLGGLPANLGLDAVFPNASMPMTDLVSGWAAFAASLIIAVVAFFVTRQLAPRSRAPKRAARVVLLNRIAKQLRRRGG